MKHRFRVSAAVMTLACLISIGLGNAAKVDLGKISPGKLKASCEKSGGSYDTTRSWYTCISNAGGAVICKKKTQACIGMPAGAAAPPPDMGAILKPKRKMPPVMDGGGGGFSRSGAHSSPPAAGSGDGM
jgi:hypothetical protein